MRFFPRFASQRRTAARCCDGRYAGGAFSPVQFATLLSERRNLCRAGQDKSDYDAPIRTPWEQSGGRAGRELVRHVAGHGRTAARGAACARFHGGSSRARCRHHRARSSSRAVGPRTAAAVQGLPRQESARSATRHQVRQCAASAARGPARHAGDGRGGRVRLSAFRPVLDRVPPPLWRDAVAVLAAAGNLQQHRFRPVAGIFRRRRATGPECRADRDGFRPRRGRTRHQR